MRSWKSAKATRNGEEYYTNCCATENILPANLSLSTKTSTIADRACSDYSGSSRQVVDRACSTFSTATNTANRTYEEEDQMRQDNSIQGETQMTNSIIESENRVSTWNSKEANQNVENVEESNLINLPDSECQQQQRASLGSCQQEKRASLGSCQQEKQPPLSSYKQEQQSSPKVDDQDRSENSNVIKFTPDSNDRNVFQDEEAVHVPSERSRSTSKKGDIPASDGGFKLKPGDLNCYWKPDRCYGLTDCLGRTGKWFCVNRSEIFSGITVAITEVPELISYALIAGVSPGLAFQSAWIMNIFTSVIGGRPGMISGASGAIAFILSKLVRNAGVEYIFFTVMFAGVLQILFGALGLGVLRRLISLPVYLGFLNIFGISIALSQIPFFKVQPEMHSRELMGITYPDQVTDGEPWVDTITFVIMLFEALAAFAICLIMSYLSKGIPNSLTALAIMSAFEWACIRPLGYRSPLIGDFYTLEQFSPKVVFLDSSYNLPALNMDTIKKIYVPVIAIFGTSLVESMMSVMLVDNLTKTKGLVSRSSIGQGLGQIVTGILGGMGGSAMVAQSVINTKSGALSGLSSFVAGLSVLIIAVGAYPSINVLPLAAFVGILLYAAFCLIQWSSFPMILAALLPKKAREFLRLNSKMRRCDSFLTLIIMIIPFFFSVAIAVTVAVVISLAVFVLDASNQLVVRRECEEGAENVIYHISGPVFFGTAQLLMDMFPPEIIRSDPSGVIVSLEGAEIFDHSGLVILHKLFSRFVGAGKTFAFADLSRNSKKMMEKTPSMWNGVNFLEFEEISSIRSQDMELRI